MSVLPLKLSEWPRHFLFLRGCLVIVGGFLVYLSLGANTIFGSMAPYIVSYARNYSQPATVKEENSMWIYAFMFLGNGVGNFIGGWMTTLIGARLTTLIGGGVMSLGITLSYFAIKISFWLVMLTYGLVLGVGVGMGIIGPVSSAMSWVPRWKGVVSGIVSIGFGISPLIFRYAQNKFINPHGIERVVDESGERHFVDEEVLGRVPVSFLLFGFVHTAIIFTGAMLITDPPQGYGSDQVGRSGADSKKFQYIEMDDEAPINVSSCTSEIKSGIKYMRERLASLHHAEHTDGEESSDIELLPTGEDADEKHDALSCSSATNADVQTQDIVISLRPLELLQKPYFYVLWGMYFFGTMVTTFSTALYTSFGGLFIKDDRYLSLVEFVAIIIGSLSRPIWGLIADQFSYKIALVLLFSLLTVFELTLYSCILGGKEMFFIWIAIIFFCVGGKLPLFSVAVGQAYGLKYVSVNYGMLITTKFILCPLLIVMSLYLTPVHVSYSVVFLLISAFSGFTFLLSIIYKAKIYVAVDSKNN